MKILCVFKDRSELTDTQRMLAPLGHELFMALGLKEAHDRINSFTPNCVFVDGDLPFSESMSWVKSLRSLAPDKYVSIVFLSTSENQLTPAYMAGCDLDFPKKSSFALWKAKLLTAERLSSLKGGEPWVSPESGGNSSTEVDAIRRSQAWQSFAAELEVGSATFLNVPVKVTKEPSDLTLDWVAGIVLANAEKQVEIRLLLGTDKVSASAFATQVFGEDSTEFQSDMIGELANLSMGVFKSGFGRAGLSFAGSLPQILSAEKYDEFASPCQFQETFTLVGPNARIRVHVGILSKKNEWVTVSNLREGMVVATDVRNERGVLLMKGGTRLSSSAVAQLRSLLNVKQTIEVASGGR